MTELQNRVRQRLVMILPRTALEDLVWRRGTEPWNFSRPYLNDFVLASWNEYKAPIMAWLDKYS